MSVTIIAHKLFDYVVLAFIIFLNCITIALERPCRLRAGSNCEWLGPFRRQGIRQRDRLPGLLWDSMPGWGQGAESFYEAGWPAAEGGVAGSSLREGLPPWTVKWQPSWVPPWLKAEAVKFWDAPWTHSLSRPFSGTHLPHCVQLHLHSYLHRGSR